eukprot:Skav227051  [mRNA]  locus=scaffold72:742845:743276:- [translate_table: standard]
MALNVLVVGEIGDGKSTMIEAVRDRHGTQPARSGLDPRGVTKEITMYPATIRTGPRASRRLFFIDTPGIGDHDISMVTFLTLLETCLAPGMVPGGIHAILVTCPVPRCRLGQGRLLLQQLIQLGFQGSGRDLYATWFEIFDQF